MAPTQLAFGLVADLVFKFGIHQKPALTAGCDNGEFATHGGLSVCGRSVCFDVAFGRRFGRLVSFLGEVDSCRRKSEAGRTDTCQATYSSFTSLIIGYYNAIVGD